jgi:hypothetical protein
LKLKNLTIPKSLADIDADLAEENLAHLNDLRHRFPSVTRTIDTYGLKVEACLNGQHRAFPGGL